MAPSANPFAQKKKKLAEKLDVGRFLTGDKTQMLANIHEIRGMRNAWIREQIVTHRNFKLLAEVLGMDILEGVHDAIIEHQEKFRDKSIVLAWRGVGKSWVGTIVKCIGELLCDRNFRIVIVSKKAQLAQNLLNAIKGHFEQNELLREVFGDYVGQEIWSNVQILVKGARKEVTPSIVVIGTEGAIAGYHPDMLILDDPTNEENSRTDAHREKLETWFNKSAYPTLIPRTAKRPYSGQIHVLATRYHPKDLVRQLQEKWGEDRLLVLTPLNKDGTPRDPERFGLEKLEEIKRDIGLIAYKTQYDMDDRAMNGSYFPLDNLDMVEWDQVPDKGLLFMGVDLAPGLDDGNDRSAVVVMRVAPNGHRFVVDSRAGRWTLMEQVHNIMQVYRRWRPMRIGIEAIAYQAVMTQLISARIAEPGLVVVGLRHTMSKEQRAMSLTPLTDARMLHFAKGTHEVRDEMVFYPEGDHDDFVDAVEFCQRISTIAAIQHRSGRKRGNIVYGRRGR